LFYDILSSHTLLMDLSAEVESHIEALCQAEADAWTAHDELIHAATPQARVEIQTRAKKAIARARALLPATALGGDCPD
jgi:hypothetical protein